MLNWLFGRKDLGKHLGRTKVIRISGVRFEIRKINALNYLDGTKSLAATYQIYKNAKTDTQDVVSNKKVMEHFSHVLYAGVVSPKLSLVDDGSGIYIETMFVDWDMVVELYNAIMEYTYGKKKMKQSALLGIN